MDAILIGFSSLFSDPVNLIVLVFGIFLGIVFGCIPGLTATLGVTLMIPFTYTMTPIAGLTLLIAIYVGGISGGLITATLINIPGTPSSIFTCYDGYPMAKSGKPGEALSIGVFASLVGGTFSAFALFFIAPPLSMVSLIFGSWEYFSVAFLGLAVVITMASDDMLKGLIGAIFGMVLGCVGMDDVSGAQRLVFGHWQLMSGLQSTALMMGMFAICEIMIQSHTIGSFRYNINLKGLSFRPPLGIGILPGIGQNAATLITYNQAKKMSKHPERFGHGSPEGICASETSNNAVNGGALIPLVTLGIPGDMTTAALVGGLMIHGLQPGPLLFTTNVDVVGAIMVAYFISNIVMYIMELGLMKVFVKAVNVRRSFLFSAILLFCILGAFAINNRTFDIWVLIFSGVGAYIFTQFKIDLAPVILGYILGPLVESYFRMALIADNGHFLMIFTRPIAAVCFIGALLFLLYPLIKKVVLKVRG